MCSYPHDLHSHTPPHPANVALYSLHSWPAEREREWLASFIQLWCATEPESGLFVSRVVHLLQPCAPGPWSEQLSMQSSPSQEHPVQVGAKVPCLVLQVLWCPASRLPIGAQRKLEPSADLTAE